MTSVALRPRIAAEQWPSSRWLLLVGLLSIAFVALLGVSPAHATHLYGMEDCAYGDQAALPCPDEPVTVASVAKIPVLPVSCGLASDGLQRVADPRKCVADLGLPRASAPTVALPAICLPENSSFDALACIDAITPPLPDLPPQAAEAVSAPLLMATQPRAVSLSSRCEGLATPYLCARDIVMEVLGEDRCIVTAPLPRCLEPTHEPVPPPDPVLCYVDAGRCDPDGDGIVNDNDACDNEAGPATTRGCPDRDGDGIRDTEDYCPDQPGTPQTNGCPDLDGDGVDDRFDACPDEPAPSESDGCPRIEDNSPVVEPDEPDGSQDLGDADEWNGDPNETHETSETAGGGQGYYGGSAAQAGLRCDDDDPVFGETFFDYANAGGLLATAEPAAASAEAALFDALALPMMPSLSPARFQESHRQAGFRRYTLVANDRPQAIIEVAGGDGKTWSPYRFAACSKILNAGIAAR